MKFSDIKGNEAVKAALRGMVDSGKIPHAIMFHENDGGAGIPLAVAFLQYLYCSARGTDSCGECPSCNKLTKLIHPDVHFVYPVTAKSLAVDYLPKWRKLILENPSFTEADFNEAMEFESKAAIIAVSEAKEMLDCLSLSALEGGYRSVVIYLPEKMNQEAANKLLKLIEEPPALTQFLLVTHAPERVLTTIASRCQRIRLVPGGQQAGRREFPEFISLMDALCRKDLLAALSCGEEMSALSRESLKECCRFAADQLREIFLAQQNLGSLSSGGGNASRWAAGLKKSFPRLAMSALDRASSLLDRNVNPKIVFTDFVDRLYMNL